jgi:hypothetical protein
VVPIYESTRRHNPEEHYHSHRCENLKSHKIPRGRFTHNNLYLVFITVSDT